MSMHGKGSNAPKRINPLFNAVFTRVFGSNDARELPQALVNSILARAGIDSIGSVDRVEAERTMLGESVSLKYPRLDVLLSCEGNRLVDLESERNDPDIDDRFLYYAAKLITEGVRPGEGYDLVPTVVSVILYDEHIVFPESPEIVSVCRLAWNCGGSSYPGSKRMVFVLVDLQKFRRQHPTLDADVVADEMLSWLYLLTEGYKNEEAVRAMEEVIPTVERFAERYGLALDDPNIKRAYDQYISSMITERNIIRRAEKEGHEKGFEVGVAEGRAQGRAEGRAEGAESIVAHLRAAGVDPVLLDEALAAEGIDA